MHRRLFLSRLGVAGAASVLAGCARTFGIPIDVMARAEPGAGDARDPAGLWREGAAYARWAPSPHNVQPWRLRIISDTRSELYCDPSRLLRKTDPTSAFTTMGMAMFVEYLSVALHSRGYTVHAEYAGNPIDYRAARPVLFAALELRPADGDAAVDRELILARKTSRLSYDGNPVEDSVLERLVTFAGQGGHRFQSSSDPGLVAWTLELNRFTLFSDLDDADARGELRQWIRCTDPEAQEHKDGLWAHCLRFPGWLLRAFFDEHEKWARGWRADLCGRLLLRGMRGTRTVGWWSGPFEKPDDWVSAGRVLGRSWLELTRLGIQLHPFGSIITNPRAYARLTERLTAPSGNDRIWMLFRVGRSDVPPRSYRLDEPKIFLSDAELS
jgi:nitroreductase